MKIFSSDIGEEYVFESWYDTVVDSALIAGVVIYDRKENIKKVKNDRISVIPVPRYSNKKKVRLNPWDEECKNAVNHRKEYYKRFVKSSSRESLEKYRTVSILIRKTLRRKTKNFNKFVNKLNLRSGPGLFWRTISAFRNSHWFENMTPPILSKQENIKKYLNNFTTELGCTYLIAKKTKFPFFFNFDFSLENLKEIIFSARFRPNQLLKLLPDSALSKLLEIF